MCPRGKRYVNRRGPSKEPWGTPLETGEEQDLRFLSWANCVRPVRRSSQRDVSDSNGGQSVQEDVMRNSVKGCAEVEENQDGE